MKKDDVVIFSYTRAQAIADGVLVDASELAKEAGFRFPVAVTAGVWAECVAVPDGVAGQDETGRLWDVLNVLRFAIQRGRRYKDHCDARVPRLLDVLNKARYAVERPKSQTLNGSISRCMSERTTARENRRR